MNYTINMLSSNPNVNNQLYFKGSPSKKVQNIITGTIDTAENKKIWQRMAADLTSSRAEMLKKADKEYLQEMRRTHSIDYNKNMDIEYDKKTGVVYETYTEETYNSTYRDGRDIMGCYDPNLPPKYRTTKREIGVLPSYRQQYEQNKKIAAEEAIAKNIQFKNERNEDYINDFKKKYGDNIKIDKHGILYNQEEVRIPSRYEPSGDPREPYPIYDDNDPKYRTSWVERGILPYPETYKK